MAKKKKEMPVQNAMGFLPDMMAESEKAIQNGLAEACGLGQFNAFGLPGQGVGFPGTETISGVNTVFKNLRWFLISNFRQVLSEMYVEIGLVQTIVDLPVDDALRGGIDIKSKQLDEDQIQELQTNMDRDNDIQTVGRSAKWTRLFGGGAVIILTDQDPEEPLDLNSITKDTPVELRAVDMWELFQDKQNIEGSVLPDPSEDFDHYNYYGEKIHKSRVMRMKGLEAPSFIRPRLRGWGFSVCEILIRSINQYLKGTDLGFEVLDEFKVDVYKIKNLVTTLGSPNGQDKIQKRIQLANRQKNYQNAVVMDSEDDWDHKQLSFAGLAEAMAGIRKQVAADLRMPLTKLFGASESGGIGNNDQNDMENYNSMVESTVRNKIKYDLLKVCEIKCQQLFGMVPDDLSITFKPLRILTAEQEENVKNAKFQRVFQAKQTGDISTFEFREACNKGALFDISLDLAGDELNPDDPQVKDIVEKEIPDPVDETSDDEESEKSKDEKPKKKINNEIDYDAEIARLLDEAEKLDDKNRPHDAEARREKARKLEKEKAAASKSKKQNDVSNTYRFTKTERINRVLKNSAEFDRASYAADGGDDWIDERRKELFENPGNVDEALWAKAKDASVSAFGKVKWQFVTWFYRKQGGKFS